MKIYKYYWSDCCEDNVVGIVWANSLKEAKQCIQNTYATCDDFEIGYVEVEEAEFNDNNCCEIFYG